MAKLASPPLLEVNNPISGRIHLVSLYMHTLNNLVSLGLIQMEQKQPDAAHLAVNDQLSSVTDTKELV